MASVRKFWKKHLGFRVPRGMRKRLKEPWRPGGELLEFAAERGGGFFVQASVKGNVMLLWVVASGRCFWLKNFLDDCRWFWRRKLFDFSEVDCWKYLGE